MQYVEGIPKFLYHYTSLDVLEKILLNKTIRFRSLEVMDDKMEARTADCSNLGKYVFASCWSEVEDSIPQWYMYGDRSRGVCLKLHSFPFKNYYQEYLDKAYLFEPLKMEINAGEQCIIPAEIFFHQSYMTYPIFIGDIRDSIALKEARLTSRVDYTDDELLLMPKCLDLTSPNEIRLKIQALGKYKHSGWQFQKEWKYRLIYLPFGMKDISSFAPDYKQLQYAFRAILDNTASIIDYVDFGINEEDLNTAEVIAGPMMFEKDFKKLYEFIIHNNPSIKLTKSRFTSNWITN